MGDETGSGGSGERGTGERGETLAAAVRRLVPDTSWSRAKALVEEGALRVGDTVERDPAKRLAGGEPLTLGNPSGARTVELLPDSAILYADGDVVVVDKPSGVLTLPVDERDRDTLVQRVQVALRRRERRLEASEKVAKGAKGRAGGRSPDAPSLPPLRVVQRLDRETSGVLVLARSIAAARGLQAQLRGRAMTRRYLALVHGHPRAGTLESLLVENRGDGLRGSWRPRGKEQEPPFEAREAITEIEPLEDFADASLVACRLYTGRQHQIRIHLSEDGHPLLGETVYVRDFLRSGGRPLAAPRTMLHAAELSFVHPGRRRQELSFTAPLPADFATLLEELRSGEGAR